MLGVILYTCLIYCSTTFLGIKMLKMTNFACVHFQTLWHKYFGQYIIPVGGAGQIDLNRIFKLIESDNEAMDVIGSKSTS